MPDPLDRHSRPGKNASFGGESPGLSRSQLRRIAVTRDEQIRSAPGKKDPGMCKAAHWKQPHQPVLQMKTYGWLKNPACGWWINYRHGDMIVTYGCHHEERCAGCEKILRNHIPVDQCPQYHPITPAEQAAVGTEIARRTMLVEARRIKYPRLRKPVIDGPQGYRKKKEAN